MKQSQVPHILIETFGKTMPPGILDKMSTDLADLFIKAMGEGHLTRPDLISIGAVAYFMGMKCALEEKKALDESKV